MLSIDYDLNQAVVLKDGVKYCIPANKLVVYNINNEQIIKTNNKTLCKV